MGVGVDVGRCGWLWMWVAVGVAVGVGGCGWLWMFYILFFVCLFCVL